MENDKRIMGKRQIFHSKLYRICCNICSDDIPHGNAFCKSDRSNLASYGSGKNSGFFDYMVGLNNELPKVSMGEVYVPVCYESMYHVKIGADMRIGNRKLKVAGFIRDSQMNSMMASSKRFLVCEEDYENLRSLGSEEYLIEFLLTENTDTNAFKTAYEDANLPMNGSTITRPLIKMMNTLYFNGVYPVYAADKSCF